MSSSHFLCDNRYFSFSPIRLCFQRIPAYVPDRKKYTMAKAKKLPSGKRRVQLFIGKDANGKNIMKSFFALEKNAFAVIIQPE